MAAPSADAARAALVDDWWSAIEHGDQALMIAHRRADVADLNQRGRERMRAAGRLGLDAVVTGARAFAVGDRVVMTRNDRQFGVVNGDSGALTRVENGALVVELDRYRALKVREQILSAESINKTITRLGQILAVAEERDLIPRNPVRVNTRNRKLKARRKRPVYLESAEQIIAMIDAATELDAKPQARTAGRCALIATLVYAGLRIGEATALRWMDVDLANGRISVGDAKTEAGIRLVDILPALRDELLTHRHANASAKPDALVFPTSSGSRRDKDNARERVIRPVVAHAEALLATRGREPLPAGVTAHKLRHTFASILFVRGEDPPYVMAQLGHTDPAFTLRVYAHAMRRGEGDKEALKALVEGRHWAPAAPDEPSEPARDADPENDESPAAAGLPEDGRGGFRTCDLSRVKRALSH